MSDREHDNWIARILPLVGALVFFVLITLDEPKEVSSDGGVVSQKALEPKESVAPNESPDVDADSK